MTIASIDLTEPVIRLQIQSAEVATGDAEHIAIVVALPTEAYAASRKEQHFEDEEPTWEDAEWQ